MTTHPFQDRMDDYWSRRSAAYDDYQRSAHRAEEDRAAWTEVCRSLLPAAPSRVLDVGTGSGYLAFIMAALGHRVTGIDRSDGMLARARRHAAGTTPAPEFRRGDAVAPGFSPGAFDVVTNRYVMWTLREPRTALRNWLTLLRPGGTLLAIDSTWFPDGMPAPKDAGFPHWYDEIQANLPLAEATTIQATADLIRESGFEDVTVTPLDAVHALDAEHGVAPGHEVRMEYAITAHSPA